MLLMTRCCSKHILERVQIRVRQRRSFKTTSLLLFSHRYYPPSSDPTMPLWRIFAHSSTFTPPQRSGLAKAITALYVSPGLPAFYVNVLFIDLPDKDGKNLFSVRGGEPRPNFVRIVVEQIARTMTSPESEERRKTRKGWMDRINEVRTRLPS